MDSGQVVLLIDHQELNGKRTKYSLKDLMAELQRAGIMCEKRTDMPAGDYMWIVKEGNEERVLDVVIERKSHSDLARSMREKAERFDPMSRMDVQMTKMRHSGIEQQIYILEAPKPGEEEEDMHRTARTKIDENGFTIIESQSVAETVELLKQKHHEVLHQFCHYLEEPRSRPTMDDIRANVAVGLHRLQAESKVLKESRKTCGKNRCTCIKAKFDQDCRRCTNRINIGDCMINRNGWQHVRCPDHDGNMVINTTRESCGSNNCSCIKAERRRDCSRCSNKIKRGNCIVYRDGWQHVQCPGHDANAVFDLTVD